MAIKLRIKQTHEDEVSRKGSLGRIRIFLAHIGREQKTVGVMQLLCKSIFFILFYLSEELIVKKGSNMQSVIIIV